MDFLARPVTFFMFCLWVHSVLVHMLVLAQA